MKGKNGWLARFGFCSFLVKILFTEVGMYRSIGMNYSKIKTSYEGVHRRLTFNLWKFAIIMVITENWRT